MIWRRLVIMWRRWAYSFRESLFALPVIIVAAGVVCAEIAAAVDRRLAGGEVPFAFTMTSDAATWLLSIVAGATITTAGVVFSLTVVSLQLASSQFSPRVMRSFVRDQLSQCVVGLLIATFVYCVLVLRTVSGDPQALAPPVSLSLAVVMAVATVLLIIAHLDHLAQRLQVGQVVRAIAHEGTAVTRTVLERTALERALHGDMPEPPSSVLTVHAPKDGWVTQASGSDILAAIPPGTTVRLETRTGAYIHEGEVLATLWPPPARPKKAALWVSRMIVVGNTRTMQEDIDFSLRQLVDVGLRALSSAINDPNTAVEVILRLGSLLRRVLSSPLPAAAVTGSAGRVLLRPWELDHEEYIAHAFDQLRHFATEQIQVATVMLRTLKMLEEQAEQEQRTHQVAALKRQTDLLLEALDRNADIHPADLQRLHQVTSTRSDPADHSHDMNPGPQMA